MLSLVISIVTNNLWTFR